ncbi:hypothetical protein TrRE_jg1613, partial [Triparma retinervis]
MGMLGDMMENMAERVVPVEVGGGAERETGPPPASEKVLRTIPEIVVGEEDLVDEANRECCVCLEENAIGSTVKRLPCGHLFHPQCIDGWITHHCTCPVCRYELDTDDAAYNRGRLSRMKGRKPRYHLYELERMRAKELKELARSLEVKADGCTDKGEVVERIANSGKIDIIRGGGKGRAFTMEEISGMKVKQLKALLRERGVSWREEDVVERGDLVRVLVNSGRVEVTGEGREEEDIMGIDEGEGEEEGKGDEEGKGGEEGKGEGEGKEEEGWVDVGATARSEEEEKEEEKLAGERKKRDREDSGEVLSEDLGSTGIKMQELASMSVGELKRICREKGVDVRGVVEKRELVDRIVASGVVL